MFYRVPLLTISSFFYCQKLIDEMPERDDLHHLDQEKLTGDIERRKRGDPLVSCQKPFGHLNYIPLQLHPFFQVFLCPQQSHDFGK